jgi:hypothetical protein
MKPFADTLAVVTATVNPTRASRCFESWSGKADRHLPVYVVWSDLETLEAEVPQETLVARVHTGTQAILDAFAPGVTILQHQGGGVVPAFAKGVAAAFADGAEAVVCLHDDVLIEQPGWDLGVQNALDRGMRFGGFGGATRLGSASLYVEPFDPMQLARGGFVSNLRDAEAHGARSRVAVKCVCFDGFCQIGTKDWFGTAWQALVDLGIQHHLYDGLLGCLAARAGAQLGWMIPVACHHFGGATAVGSQAYQAWAKTQHAEGDQGFWLEAHRRGAEEFKDQLPLELGRFR